MKKGQIMKKLFIFLVLVSCDGSISSKEYRSPCDQALDHIESCLGYRPKLIRCSIKNGEEILKTSCEDIRSLWE